MTNKYYITTPIYYVNDKPHLGHAYTSVACDAIARYMRLDGLDVRFLTGTDEHGQKVEKSAKTAGIPPQVFVDEVSEHFRDMAKLLNLTNDDFIRTTEPRHYESTQELWKKLAASGDIYLANYGGWYATRDEAFYQIEELKFVGKDGQPVANEKGEPVDFTRYSTEQLREHITNGSGKLIAPSGAEVEWVEEPSYFFALSKYQQKLLDLYQSNPDFILPASRRNEVIRFVEGGLKDLSISRTTFKWGIPVPGDEQHIMYVWLDALNNYVTAADGFWPASLHMVGKDILRFHAVYWPAFLMSAKIDLPKRVFAHGWWTIEGEKMSKSLGNVVAPAHLVEKYGLDQTRYFLLREVPFGSDGNFSRQNMHDRINAELANTIGNLAQRTLSMIAKNCNESVPTPDSATLQPADKELLDLVHVTRAGTAEQTRRDMQECKFDVVMGGILTMAHQANAYIDAQAPWGLKKTDPARMQSVLYYLAEAIRCIAIMLQPFTPDAAGKMLDQLAVPQDKRLFKHLAPEYALTPGTPLPKPEGVFPRLVAEEA